MIYADTLQNLKYSQGMVSFILTAADQPSHLRSVHIPFSDFQEMVRLLYSELPKIHMVHVNWIAEQGRLNEALPPEIDPTPKSERSILGQKIGSV